MKCEICVLLICAKMNFSTDEGKNDFLLELKAEKAPVVLDQLSTWLVCMSLDEDEQHVTMLQRTLMLTQPERTEETRTNKQVELLWDSLSVCVQRDDIMMQL